MTYQDKTESGNSETNTPRHLLDNNLAWATSIKEKEPDFFSKLSQQQTPEYLWIGCSDSRVPVNQIIDLMPGQVFVHRNIANVIVQSDLNSLSVIQYAVDVLKVKHIIVCGHYGCGGIAAAIEDKEHGLIDNWLQHIKNVIRVHSDELKKLKGDTLHKRLCELNVIEQVINICNTTIVKCAWKRGANLNVNGWIYSLENGLIHDLNIQIGSTSDLKQKLDSF